MRILIVAFGALFLLGDMTTAQTSEDYKLEEYVFNAWGVSSQNQTPQSGSFELTLAMMGDAIVASGLNSSAFQLNAGFLAGYLPPGEVAHACGTPGNGCLVFTNAQTLTWPDEPSAGVYSLYRGSMRDDFGACEQAELPNPIATDTATPPSSEAFYYLLTVKNRLGEEGTKGFQSDMTERLGATCP